MYTDSLWNQFLREEIHHVFVEALDVFKKHSGLSIIDAVCRFLSFVPMEDSTLDFFRPVSRAIIRELVSKPCLPSQPSTTGGMKMYSLLILTFFHFVLISWTIYKFGSVRGLEAIRHLRRSRVRGDPSSAEKKFYSFSICHF